MTTPASVCLPAPRSSQRNRRSAFTLIELLVVISIIGLLASMLLPALSKTKHSARSLQCLNHKRSLALGWMLYADDHDGKLVPNREHSADGWIRGVLDFDSSNPDNTNALYLVDGRWAKLGPYVSSAAPFACPADQSELSYSGRKVARVRSVAMNFAVGAAEQPGHLPFASGSMVYRKSSDIRNPSGLWVIIDEHEDSLDDGRFVVDCERREEQAQLISVPGNFHHGAATISFADGHAEVHAWRDPATRVANKYCGCIAHYVVQGFYIRTPNNPDVAWVQERTSTLIK
jgi:prepilin-type N-terminal cleavage/methylation domain-containing protein/prepilin-type processing-associated H-X9-DG protein